MKHLGAIVENPEHYRHMSGWQNLKLYQNMRPGVSDERLHEVVSLVGLENRIQEPVKKYSLGMRQRLAIAQAIMEDPAILLLDEPLNGLDYEGVKTVYDILKVQKERGKIILVASHHEEDIRLLCDEVYWLKDGILERIEDISEYTRFKETWVKNEKTD